MKKRRSVMQAAFLASLSLILTMAVAASLTFALFFDTAHNTDNRVQAGNLTISVDLVNKLGKQLNTETGKLEAITFDTENGGYSLLDKNLEDNEKPAPLFTIEKAVPGQEQSVVIRIVNNGIVAFYYDLELTDVKVGSEVSGVANDPAINAASVALTKQIKISIVPVTDATGNTNVEGVEPLSMYLDAIEGNCKLGGKGVEGYELAPNNSAVPAAPSAGSYGYFKITATFVDDDALDPSENRGTNNEAENGVVSFDFKITATQSTD